MFSDFPKDLYEKAYKAGMYGATWPAQYKGTFPTREEMDPYYAFILADELGRCVCHYRIIMSKCL